MTVFISKILILASNSYWTGYFTSRPTFKYHERQSNAILQTGKQINAVLASEMENELERLQMELGICQHHDAITGTSKQPVDYDFHLRLE